MKNDAIVIGAGLFGSTIALALAKQGRKVLVFDDNNPMAGSKPSGGLMKPGWFSGMGKEVHEPALKLLFEIAPVRELEFKVQAGPLKFKIEKVFQMNNHDLNGVKDISLFPYRISSITNNKVQIVNGTLVYEFFSPLIIVAAGIWSKDLIPCDIKGLKGISFFFEGNMAQGVIAPWAPYKQTVAFEKEPGVVWGGDGSAILTKNWTVERRDECLARVQKVLPTPFGLNYYREGIRPYAPGQKPCLLRKVRPGLYLATGGAKNGAIAAGWCAHRILQETA